MSKISFKALLLASFGLMSAACSDKCLRHTDCDKGAVCSEGVCAIVVHGDASVAALTPTAPAPQPVDSISPPPPPAIEAAAPPVTPVTDAGARVDAAIVAP